MMGSRRFLLAKLLTIDEMLEAARLSKMDGANIFVDIIEAVANQLAERLCLHLNVDVDLAHFDYPGGILVPFYPKEPGQECPEVLKHFDPDEWGD